MPKEMQMIDNRNSIKLIEKKPFQREKRRTVNIIGEGRVIDMFPLYYFSIYWFEFFELKPQFTFQNQVDNSFVNMKFQYREENVCKFTTSFHHCHQIHKFSHAQGGKALGRSLYHRRRRNLNCIQVRA